MAESTEEKVIDLRKRKGNKMSPPFVSHNGNPENGNYAEWFESQASEHNSLITLIPEQLP